jgi:nonsense-mediated mRNA decay protein 3
LGNILNPGDHVKGYMLLNTNFNHDNFDALGRGKQGGLIPDIVLVRKSYPNARKKSRSRNWKLKSMAKVEDLEGRTKNEKQTAERDLEVFLRDVEEDSELRGMMNLFKTPNAEEEEDDQMIDSEEEPEEDFPEINMDELLDDFDEMNVRDEDEDEMIEE